MRYDNQEPTFDLRIETVTVPNAPTVMETMRQAGVALMLWGHSGVGITAGIEAYRSLLANRTGVADVPVADLALLAAPDLLHPDVDFRAPGWFSRSEVGILLLDNIVDLARRLPIATLARLLGRSMNGAPIPKGWLICATAHRGEEEEVMRLLTGGLGGFFAHHEVVPDILAWLEWGAGPGGIRAELLAFINSQPDFLLQLPRRNSSGANRVITANPRAWANASACLTGVGATLDRSEQDKHIGALRGILGEEAAAAFLHFVDRMNAELPPVKHLLTIASLPDAATHIGDMLPKDPSMLMALAFMIVEKATSLHAAMSALRLVEIAGELENGNPQFPIPMFREHLLRLLVVKARGIKGFLDAVVRSPSLVQLYEGTR